VEQVAVWKDFRSQLEIIVAHVDVDYVENDNDPIVAEHEFLLMWLGDFDQFSGHWAGLHQLAHDAERIGVSGVEHKVVFEQLEDWHVDIQVQVLLHQHSEVLIEPTELHAESENALSQLDAHKVVLLYELLAPVHQLVTLLVARLQLLVSIQFRIF